MRAFGQRLSLSLSLCLALAACGVSEGKLTYPGLVDAALVRAGAKQAPTPTPDPARAAVGGLTPEVVDGSPTPLMLVRAQGQVGLMAPVSVVGDTVTWGGPRDQAVVLTGGFLAATRGLGDDLMGADVTGLRAVLRGGSHVRRMAWLDGLDQPVERRFTCVVTPQGPDKIEIVGRSYAVTKVQEKCTGEALTFSNVYWLDRGGVLRQSQQFASVQGGYVTTVQLAPR